MPAVNIPSDPDSEPGAVPEVVGYQYITEQALLDEARTWAPYKETGKATNHNEALPIRKLRRLQNWYNKSIEFRVAHRASAIHFRKRLNSFQILSLVLSTTITIVLIIFGTVRAAVV